MSQINVDSIKNRTGGAVNAPAGINVTGLSTITGNLTVTGVLTYEDVANVDSVGIITAQTGIKVLAGGINAVGVVTATSFSGDGSSLTGVDGTLDNWLYG
tara:strand:- start:360 stop:659 length:300 start_codon:yes stop_codon:yes gene_type:complete